MEEILIYVLIGMMFAALTFNFIDPELMNILQDTNDKLLVQVQPRDSYCGSGKEGTGENILAIMLMSLRD